MNKWGLLALIVLGLTACTEKNAEYYRTHPKELKQALDHCEEHKAGLVTCQQLEDIVSVIQPLAYQLQQNPQGFGIKILKLQEDIAKQQLTVKANPDDKKLQEALNQNRQKLADLLTVVKWLESPEG